MDKNNKNKCRNCETKEVECGFCGFVKPCILNSIMYGLGCCEDCKKERKNKKR